MLTGTGCYRFVETVGYINACAYSSHWCRRHWRHWRIWWTLRTI